MNTLKNVASIILKEQTFAIFCHVRPDGDTLGSALTLQKALVKMGKMAEVFCDEKPSEKFSFINGIEDIKYALDKSFDCFISVDVSDPLRMGCFCADFKKHKNSINIDHHISNLKFAKVNYVVNNASNCENIFDLIKELNVPFDSDMATTLLCGMITDTGNFSQQNSTASAMRKASELVECGGDFYKINYIMFKSQKKERAKLFARAMSGIQFFHQDKMALIVITLDDLKQTGCTKETTEGFIDFVLSIDCVDVAISLLEYKKDLFKIGFRGKKTNVNAIASVYGGGGHVLASGCMIAGDKYEVIDKLKYTVSQYME